MHTRKVLVTLAMAGSLLLAACGPAKPATATLSDTSWILVTLHGQAVLPTPTVSLTFENGRISGRDGCNSYGSSYTSSGGKLVINKDIMSTMMACADPIMQQAQAYMMALINATSYTSDGQQLTLLDKSGKSLATFKMQSRTLGGTSWTVTGYNNGKQAVVSILTGTTLTADFSADGKLTGSAGCNSYMGAYEASGTSVKVGQLGTTKMLCHDPAGVMDQEMQYVAALKTVATFRLDGDRLELHTADGALAVSLVRTR